MREEIFGPVMPVFPFKDIREVIKFINERDKPLAVYYFGNATGSNANLISRETSSGAFVANEVITHINSHALGFGGVGMSGVGRHGGFVGFQNFSNRKGIFLKNPSPPFITKLLMPPYSENVQKNLRKWAVTLLVTNWSYITWYVKLVGVVLILLLIKMFFF